MIKKTLATLALLGFASSAQAVVIDFDDITGASISGSWRYLDVPTEGFAFSRPASVIDVTHSYYNFGSHSGDFALLNNGGSGVINVTATDNSDFTFDGVWAKVWGTPPESGVSAGNRHGLMQGFNNGALVWSVNTTLHGSYQFLEAQTGLIDQLVLRMGNYYLIDDLALNEVAPSVPVPAGLPLIASGLAALGFLGRRKTRKA